MIKFIPLIIALLFISCLSAQSFLGMEADNYSGIHGAIFNPANIADSRSKIDVNIFSANALIGTDYTPLSLDNIKILFEDSNSVNAIERFPTDNNQVNVNADLLSTSFMFSLNEKSSIGLISRVRTVNNYNNLNGQLLESFADGFPSEDYDFNMSNLNGTTHVWGEIGLVYGRTIFEKDYHFLKGGITLKYLRGAIFAQGNSETLSGDYNATQRTLNTNGSFSYLINYDADEEFNSDKLKPGFGMDIGFVYEYRPRSSDFSSGNADPRGANKYKFKVGVALVDFGTIKYEDVVQNNYNLDASVNTNDFDSEFQQKLDDNYVKDTIVGNVTAALPTSLRINGDYRFTKNIYASVNYSLSLNPRNGLYNNNTLNVITFAPRFESKFMSLYTPMNYSNLGGLTFGAGLRIGPLIVGSGTLFSTLFSKKPDLANVYVGLKVPMYHGKKSKQRKRRR
ncbi:hypothetical protein JQC67_04675 [Aurantibacter crassamenti]|uniref:DUF5723 family protein n=1 Tax=Aurantibacter crassamenti TaxID=1837375 RepID=UPI001939F1BE|nr:DUF5723 family protein [Aurantibacter crassamenti]MBM1105431.1 hypothetical protein [Aurantibacter crassamenti]